MCVGGTETNSSIRTMVIVSFIRFTGFALFVLTVLRFIHPLEKVGFFLVFFVCVGMFQMLLQRKYISEYYGKKKQRN